MRLIYIHQIYKSVIKQYNITLKDYNIVFKMAEAHKYKFKQ